MTCVVRLTAGGHSARRPYNKFPGLDSDQRSPLQRRMSCLLDDPGIGGMVPAARLERAIRGSKDRWLTVGLRRRTGAPPGSRTLQNLLKREVHPPMLAARNEGARLRALDLDPL